MLIPPVFVVQIRRPVNRQPDQKTMLLKKGIFGGKDLSNESPDLKNCALYCVTEIHTQGDIDQLIDALKDGLS